MKTLKRIQNKIITFWKWIKQKSIFILKKIKQLFGWIKSRINATLFITLFITLIATVLGGWAVDSIIKEENFRKFRSKPFLTFESDYTQVFRLSKEVDSLEYSVGEHEWSKLEKGQTIVFGGNRGKLMLRGESKKGTNGATIIFGTDAEVVCSGDLYTLVDYKHYDKLYKTNPISSANFNSLFENCTQLVVAPELSSTVLVDNCYEKMFSGCTSLKRAPELPAKNLKKRCYQNMFIGCTSLEEVPVIKAESLAEGCCKGMFMGCISLKEAPVLLAEQLEKNCYSYMFSGCSSLKKAPELRALNLAFGCYLGMFSNCTSLSTAPYLKAKKLVDFCYYKLFSGCTSLSMVKISATEIEDDRYQFNSWLEGVPSDGFFYKNKDARWDNNGIVPKDWIIKSFNPDDPDEN